MTILNILQFPDPKLRIKAQPVDNFDEKLQIKIDDMFETMYDAKGIGLAGTQVDFHESLLVTDVSHDKDQPYVLINPEILSTNGIVDSNEGCLSVPGFQDDVQRAKNIIVKYLDREGVSKECEMSGLLAICVQHEIDHLNGKLFIDYLSEAKKQKIRKLIRKQEKD
tara:strand:- start:2902 stop:3399 length:498 start_codon:yes stop_codon:yes gene_type:complete